MPEREPPQAPPAAFVLTRARPVAGPGGAIGTGGSPADMGQRDDGQSADGGHDIPAISAPADAAEQGHGAGGGNPDGKNISRNRRGRANKTVELEAIASMVDLLNGLPRKRRAKVLAMLCRIFV